MKKKIVTILIVLSGGACGAASAAVTAAASCGSPCSPQLDDDLCGGLLWGSGGEKKNGTPACSETRGLASTRLFPCPGISNSCGTACGLEVAAAAAAITAITPCSAMINLKWLGVMDLSTEGAGAGGSTAARAGAGCSALSECDAEGILTNKNLTGGVTRGTGVSTYDQRGNPTTTSLSYSRAERHHHTCTGKSVSSSSQHSSSLLIVFPASESVHLVSSSI